MNPAMLWILIQFEPYNIWLICGCKYLVCNICALFYWVVETLFTLAFIFILFCTSSLFRIIVVWWVRWIRWRIIWWSWIRIRVSWYARYRIGWVFVWRMITFRCHTFWWWLMWWWWRFTCSIRRYLWSGYQRVQMKWIYRRGCMGCMYWRFVSQWCSL